MAARRRFSCSHPVRVRRHAMEYVSVKAVGYRMGRVLRAQWRSTLVLTLIVAAVTGAVLAFAAGAERTASAPDRYTASRRGGFDGSVQQEGGRPRTDEVASLPGVSSLEAVTFVFGGLAMPGNPSSPDALTFAGSHLAMGMRVVDGRDPDPASPGEFVATHTFAEAKGVDLGARFDLHTLNQEQADRAGFEAFSEGAQGPSVEAVLVGVVDGPTELDDPTPLAILPRSLLDSDVGVSSTIMSVRFRPGTDLATFRTQLDSLPDGESFSLTPAEVVSAEVRTAVQGQALGLWLLAAVGAVAAVAVLGQLVSRSARLTADERPSLAAIGFSKGQLLAESVGRAAVPIVAGIVLGVAVAVGASFAFPSGFVRRIEPDPGVLVDPLVLVLCTVGLLSTLILWTVAALALARPVRGAERPSPLVESVAVRSGSATVATGFRFAFTRSSRDRGSVRAAVLGMLVTTAVLVGAVVFGSSLGRLVTDGNRFGNNFDLLFGSGGDIVPDEVLAAFEADADVAALMLYAVGQARVGPVTIRLAGMDPVKGDLGPKVVAGRLPSADDEIALGRLVADEVGSQVGADLMVEGEGGTQRFRVTGLAVIPAVEGLDGVGQDGVLTLGGLQRLDPAAVPSAAAITLRRGAPPGAAERLGLEGGNSRPVVITNLARIRSIPFLLALLVGGLAVMTVVHVMVTSVHNRRRDVAVLRALGADGRWITRAVHWQATAFSLVPLVLGVPVGLIGGRFVFEAFANSVGTVPDASFPFVLLAVVLVGLVVLANAVAEVPARRSRRLVPAALLNPE